VSLESLVRPNNGVNTPYPVASRSSDHPRSTLRRGEGSRSHASKAWPKEFAQFIGKEMRLSKVEYAPKPEAVPILNFYMGKNTPERKDYIMDKLVVPLEK